MANLRCFTLSLLHSVIFFFLTNEMNYVKAESIDVRVIYLVKEPAICDAGTFLALGRKRGDLRILWTRGEPERVCPHVRLESTQESL